MKDGATFEERSPYGSFNYFVTTPYRFITSGSVIMGNHGVLNVDYEIVDYSTARLKEDSYGYASGSGNNFTSENQSIRNNFALTQNIRVGTEWRLDPFRLRAGYRYQGNPLSSKFNNNFAASIYSLGFGIKEDDYYFDMGYALKTQENQVDVIADQGEFANTRLKDHYLTFTLGFRF